MATRPTYSGAVLAFGLGGCSRREPVEEGVQAFYALDRRFLSKAGFEPDVKTMPDPGSRAVTVVAFFR